MASNQKSLQEQKTASEWKHFYKAQMYSSMQQ